MIYDNTLLDAVVNLYINEKWTLTEIAKEYKRSSWWVN